MALIAITQQLSCSGGGGGGSTSSNADPSPAVTVSVSPSSSQISAGGSVQFVAAVQNASNPAVNWQVNGLAGGNSAVGTITPSGAGTASYMAPANVSAPLAVTVTAVLQADTTKFGAATLTINPLPGVQISVSPANAQVVTGASLQFNASVQNGPQAVIWEVDNILSGTAVIGTISSSGLYTAPTQAPNPPVVTIKALLFSDSSASASTNLTIVPPVPRVSISPSTANVAVAQTLQLMASVKNSSEGVTWQVNGVSGGSSGTGTITSFGIYTAPTNPQSLPITVTVTAVLQTSPPVSASAGVTIISANTLAGVYSWRNDDALTGQNPQEITLTPSSVSSGKFGKLFGCPVDAPVGSQIFAQPLYVANVTIPSLGTHNVVYAATEHDSVYAFDADVSSCPVLWQVSFINQTTGVTTVPATDIPGQTDIVPEIGITGTPVIDPTTATLYVVAKTKVSQGVTPSYYQKLHALDLATGAERGDSPAIIQATVKGTGDGSVSGNVSFHPLIENQRSALLLAGGNIYVAFDSYDDTPPFHGWLFAYNAADLQTAPAVFISTPNGSRGGIGESGAGPSSDSTGNVFVVTSDGTFDANTNGSDYAETLLKLQMSSAQPVANYFTPWNEFTLNLPQRHFGSTGVLLLPDSAGGAVPLAVAGSQAGSLYLVNRNKLGSFNGPNGPDNVVQTLCVGASLTGTPAYWAASNTIYFAAADDSLKAFPLANGAFSSPSCSSGSAVPTSHSNDFFNTFGASPVISSNGSGDGIVWALDTSGYATSAPTILRAYDATNLSNELYSGPISATDPLAAGAAVKFAVPPIANGKVYVGTQNELSVFGLLP